MWCRLAEVATKCACLLGTTLHVSCERGCRTVRT
jgi:hypothetical protein